MSKFSVAADSESTAFAIIELYLSGLLSPQNPKTTSSTGILYRGDKKWPFGPSTSKGADKTTH